MIKWLCSLAIFLAVFGSVRAARAHGVVGDYVFLEPIITQDPTPANELDIFAPSWVRSSDANTYAMHHRSKRYFTWMTIICRDSASAAAAIGVTHRHSKARVSMD